MLKNVFVNAKIFILSYKISIFIFTKIVLEYSYLEMIVPLISSKAPLKKIHLLHLFGEFDSLCTDLVFFPFFLGTKRFSCHVYATTIGFIELWQCAIYTIVTYMHLGHYLFQFAVPMWITYYIVYRFPLSNLAYFI